MIESTDDLPKEMEVIGLYARKTKAGTVSESVDVMSRILPLPLLKNVADVLNSDGKISPRADNSARRPAMDIPARVCIEANRGVGGYDHRPPTATNAP